MPARPAAARRRRPAAGPIWTPRPRWPACRPRARTTMVHGHTHRPGPVDAGAGLRAPRAQRLGPGRRAARAPRCCACAATASRACPRTPPHAPDGRLVAAAAPAQRAARRRAPRHPRRALAADAGALPLPGAARCGRPDRTAPPEQPVPRPQGIQRRARPAGQRRHGGGHRRAGLPAGAAPGPAALRRLRRHRRAPGRGAGAARVRRRRRRRARVRRRAGRRGHGRRPGDAVVARRQRRRRIGRLGLQRGGARVRPCAGHGRRRWPTAFRRCPATPSAAAGRRC